VSGAPLPRVGPMRRADRAPDRGRHDGRDRTAVASVPSAIA
jgi:hypothetical protein